METNTLYFTCDMVKIAESDPVVPPGDCNVTEAVKSRARLRKRMKYNLVLIINVHGAVKQTICAHIYLITITWSKLCSSVLESMIKIRVEQGLKTCKSVRGSYSADCGAQSFINLSYWTLKLLCLLESGQWGSHKTNLPDGEQVNNAPALAYM